MPNSSIANSVLLDQLIATATGGKVVDRKIYDDLHRCKTHWILSLEGAVAIADTIGTTILSGSVVIITTSCLFASLMSAVDENSPNRNSEELNQFFIDRSLRAIIWAKQRISQSFSEAQQSVFDRVQVSNHVTLTQKNCGDTIMSSATA